MSPLLEIILPIFLVVFIGYAVARAGMFDKKATEVLSRFVFNITLPLLLFHSLATVSLPEEIEWEFLLSYYLIALVLFGAGALTGRLGFAYDLRGQGLFGMGASYSNMVVLGLPIVLNAFGDAAILPMFLLISVHSALIFSLVTLFAELDGAGSRLRELGATLRGIVTNPILLGLMAGLVFNLLGITLPGPLEDTVALLGDSALPTALFAVGATLSQYRLSGHYTEALVLVVLKIIAQPLLVWLLAFHVFQIDPIWGAVAVVAAGMPTGINSYLFAQRYGVAIEPMASAIVLSTLLTVGTVPFIISQFL